MAVNVLPSPDGSPLAPLNVAQQKLADLLSASFSKIAENQAKETFSYVKFALLAVETKIAHPIDFNKVADAEEFMPKKELHRLMQLVLENSVPFRKAMAVSGKNVDIDKNVALLKIDKNMQKLTLKSISNMIEPSRAKLLYMKKHLTDADFKTVLDGDDTPFNAHKDSVETKKQAEHTAEKPDNISTDLYDSLYKAGIYPAIRQVAEFMGKVNSLETEKQDYISEIANLKGQLQVFEKMSGTIQVDLSEVEQSKQVAQ